MFEILPAVQVVWVFYPYNNDIVDLSFVEEYIIFVLMLKVCAFVVCVEEDDIDASIGGSHSGTNFLYPPSVTEFKYSVIPHISVCMRSVL